MIKIVVINGSPRKNGATAIMLEEMVEYLHLKGDTEIKYINLANYNLNYCIGCMKCYQNAKCFQTDQLEDIVKLISNSDGVIIGSPTYASNISGILKTLIDRGHFVLEQALMGKYTFGLVTCEIAGGNNTLSILNSLFLYSGGITAGEFIHKLSYNTNPFSNNNVRLSLQSKTDNFYMCIKKKKSKGLFCKIKSYIAFNFVIKPQVLKKPQQYKAVIARWKMCNLIK